MEKGRHRFPDDGQVDQDLLLQMLHAFAFGNHGQALGVKQLRRLLTLGFYVSTSFFRNGQSVFCRW
jgi:hypothetical protein